MEKRTKFILSALVLAAGILVSYSVLAQTTNTNSGDSAAPNIAFPIAQLGNCTDKESCRTYCEKPENMEACIAFAKSNGLMEKDEASRAEKFVQGIKNGNGPGGCTDKQSCDAFCNNINNLEVCIAWADKNGVKDENFNEAKKIQKFIKSGGQMPGGCNSKDSCETYCGDFSHAEECFAFAEKAGIDTGMNEGPQGPGGPNGQGSRPTKAGPPPRQMLELIKSGQTPGGCKSRNECESYCGGGDHFEECVAFAEKAGMMDPKEAEMIKKTGGKGPGGCRGQKECDVFCNNPDNRETCFKFAEENGLISPEELKMAKEGMTRMRAGLDNAPPEVKECLKSELGPNIIEDIQSGKLVPGPEIGDKMRSCFEKAGGGFKPNEVLKNAPPEVLSCLKEKNIDIEKIKSGQTEFTPEIGDTFRICFESMKMMNPNGPMMGGPEGQSGSPNFSEFLRSAPAEVTQCLESALGSDFEKLKSDELQMNQPLGEKVKTCFEQFRPQGPMMGPGGSEDQGRSMMSGPMMGGNFPKEAEDCIKSKLGEEASDKFQKGELNDPVAMEKVKTCMDSFRPQDGNQPFRENQGSPSGPMMPNQPMPGGQGGSVPSFPTEISECLKRQLSPDQVSKLMSGARPSGEVEGVIGKCFSENGTPGNMMPPQGANSPQGTQSPAGMMPPNSQMPSAGMMPPGDFRPPEGGQSPDGTPPPGFQSGQPPAGMMPPPGFAPPPGEFQNGTPPPQSSINKPSLLGVIFAPLINLLSQ